MGRKDAPGFCQPVASAGLSRIMTMSAKRLVRVPSDDAAGGRPSGAQWDGRIHR